MKKIRLILMIVVGALLIASAGGAAAWWGLRSRAAHGATKEAAADAASAPAVVDKRPQKYVSLDKVIVMLRRSDTDSSPHYLAMDLVLKTSDEQEKTTKEHLPMLRSVALRALADYTPEKAGKMSIDQFSEVINTAYTATYAHEQRDKPFSEAMIGKLIIE